MEKAKIIISQTKKKKFIAKLQFADGKNMSLPQLIVKDMSLNEKEVEVERDRGQVVLIKDEGKIIFSNRPPQKQTDFKSLTQKQTCTDINLLNKHLSKVDNPAYAPYNFVPLNDQVVETSLPIPNFNKYDTERKTGFIEIQIETLTPVYIRGTLTEKEVNDTIEIKDKPDFFAPAGKIRIPGSSLRGMTRNLVEIISYGKFEFYDNKRLYYRGLADQSSLREEYQRKMVSGGSKDKKGVYKFSAGIFRKSQTEKKGMHFEIKSSGTNFKQILKSDARIKVDNLGEIYSEFNYYNLKEEGYLVVSGNMQNKKRDWIISHPPDNAEVISLNENDIKDYYNDRMRNENVPNLLEMAKEGKEVPCFYVLRKNENSEETSVSFGHTGMFRLAYEKNIGEHVPDNLKDSEKIDFPEAIFGSTKTSDDKAFAGRVFFEDAFLINQQDDPRLNPKVPHILSGPKPTTFQHYLTQKNDNVKQLNHYNSNSTIRGYKMYWHKSCEEKQWVQHDKAAIEKAEKQYIKKGIRPVKKDTKFKGQIRFENLSNEELGALLFALKLPEGCCHKIGMGKPLGLGSVHITPTLKLSKREERYKDFFAEWNNDLKPLNDDETEKIKSDFEKYVMQELGETSKKTIWETDRLRELLTLLNIDIGKSIESKGLTRYMTISGQNEFKDRPVLPLASSLPAKAIIDGIIDNTLNQKPQKQESVIRYIKNIEIDKIWNKYKVSLDPYQDVTILAGINGSGKTTFLEIVYAGLKGNIKGAKGSPENVTIRFDTDNAIQFKCKELIKKPECEINVDYISTFDRSINTLDLSSTLRDVYDTELMNILDSKIPQFIRELNRRLVNTENLDAKKEAEQLKNRLIFYVDNFFKASAKNLKFCHTLKIDQAILNNKLNEKNIPEEDLQSLMFLNDEYFLTESDRSNKLESCFVKNSILKQHKKTILELTEFSNEQHIGFVLNGELIIKPQELSTGEKQILIIILSVLLQENKPYILLMDEPENSLHPDWQENLIITIREINPNAQIIMATHSPAIVMEGWYGHIIDIGKILKKDEG